MKNWCFWIVVLEKTLESPLDCKEIKPVNPKGNQPWMFIGRTGWSWSSSILTSWCEELTHGKGPDAGQDWGREEKGAVEDKMVGWQHWFNGHKFERTPGDSERQGSLACCSSWGWRSQTWLSEWTTTTHDAQHHQNKQPTQKNGQKNLVDISPKIYRWPLSTWKDVQQL